MSPDTHDLEILSGPVEPVRPDLTIVESSGLRRPETLTTKTRTSPNLAVVGCGYWGSKHVRVLSSMPEVGRLIAVDCDRATREKMSTAFPTVQVCSDLASALPQIDAAIIATPPGTHAELAMQCLHNGKHVLLEKPVATSLADAYSLEQTAVRSNLVFMAGHTFEFNPAVCELKRRIEIGELGSLYYIHSARLNLGLYRTDVNVIWDLAAHDVSIMNYLLSSVPSSVAAWGSRNAYAEIIDLSYIRLDYADIGVTGYAHVSWLDPNKIRQVTVVGSKKMAVYNDMVEERLRIFDRGVEKIDQQAPSFERPLSYRYGDILSPHVEFQEPLLLEVKHFLSCIQDGMIPRTGGRNGVAVVAVLQAIDAALARGSTVRVRLPGAGKAERLERSRELSGVAVR
jgi:predicted dehydrogenase